MSTGIQWWGYKHTNGNYQVKRYFGHQDIQEAKESPFCQAVFGPFIANDRDHALKTLKSIIN